MMMLMTLEALDRLTDTSELNVGPLMDVFQHSASLFDTIGKWKEITEDIKKRIVELNKSGLS